MRTTAVQRKKLMKNILQQWEYTGKNAKLYTIKNHPQAKPFQREGGYRFGF